jgi:hypothetical protein
MVLRMPLLVNYNFSHFWITILVISILLLVSVMLVAEWKFLILAY